MKHVHIVKRVLIISFLIALVLFGGWLVWLNYQTYPVEYGITFVKSHAAWLGLDWRRAYSDTLRELRPRYVRLSAMWNEIEPEKEKYRFADLDWMMNRARDAGSRVALVVGQKQPRWPECHFPEWYSKEKEEGRKKEFFEYVRRVVERYKNHPALELWQVENEPFIRFPFGECKGRFRKEWVAEEIALARSLDSAHPVLATDSGELGAWRKTALAGDYFGATLYRAVRTPGGRRVAYDLAPPALYAAKARLLLPRLDRFFISELQAEPWGTGVHPRDVPIPVQEETMNPARMRGAIEYARHIGASRAYLWGAEWWYWMKTEKNDARYWEIARGALAR